MRDLILSLLRSGGPMSGGELIREAKTLISIGYIEKPAEKVTITSLQADFDSLELDGLIRLGHEGYEAVPQRAAPVEVKELQGTFF